MIDVCVSNTQVSVGVSQSVGVVVVETGNSSLIDCSTSVDDVYMLAEFDSSGSKEVVSIK